MKAYSGGCRFDSREYDSRVLKILEERFQDDAWRDVTAESVLKKNVIVNGIIKAKENGVLAGLGEIRKFYARHGVRVRALKKDGGPLRPGDVIAELRGREADFLKVERTGLNMLQRMSGIATQTKKIADTVGRFGVKIVGTRKTVLNWPDKKAINLGGGLPHRMGLYDAILIKDNHLDAIREEGISDPIKTALKRAFFADCKNVSFIEMEAVSVKDAVKAARDYAGLRKAGVPGTPFIIMLDNVPPAKIRDAVAKLKAEGLYELVLLEASGGINKNNILEYAKSGIDVISVGALTHSAKALDISQKILSRRAM